MFDISIQAVGLDVAAPNEEQLEAGAPPLLNFVIAAGLQLPIGDPNNAGQPLVVPAGQIRFVLPKAVSLDYAKAIIESAEKIPDLKESDLIIANSLQGADKLAQQMEDISKGKS